MCRGASPVARHCTPPLQPAHAYICRPDIIYMITDLIHSRLAGIYTPEELRTLTHWIIEHVSGLTLAQQLAGKSMQMEEGQKAAITRIISRLEQHEPIQYVLGECSFHGLTFRVDRSVLIPRPETGELVERIVTNHRGEAGLRLLDIGTGSGCIAITLARKLRKPHVTALDISAEAIATARGNAHRNDAEVHFICADLFTPDLSLPTPFDLIVSNPPYVRTSEQASMAPNVLRYEPHTALFVPDSDPLRFYRRTATCAQRWLVPGGRIYFEINAALATETVALLRAEGFADVHTWRDMEGRERFIEVINEK